MRLATPCHHTQGWSVYQTDITIQLTEATDKNSHRYQIKSDPQMSVTTVDTLLQVI